MSRKYYFDYLRVFAALFVVIIHVCSPNWYSAPMNGMSWKGLNLFDSVSRWGVPIFTMISGALFLSKEVSIKKIYSKYIFRLLMAFIFWSFIYTAADSIILGKFNFVDSFNSFIRGNFHMWYILMLVGVYMCIPIFKLIVDNKKVMKYFLSLSFIIAFVIPTGINIIQDFVTRESILNVVKSINTNITTMRLGMFSCYAFYFMFGYYLSNEISIKKNHRIVIYILGLFGFLLTFFLTLIVTLKQQKHDELYYSFNTVNVFLESFALFVFFKYHKFENRKVNKFIERISKLTFGIYLVHPLIVKLLSVLFNFNSLSFNVFICVPVMTILVFIISCLITFILSYIPIIRKYCI